MRRPHQGAFLHSVIFGAFCPPRTCSPKRSRWFSMHVKLTASPLPSPSSGVQGHVLGLPALGFLASGVGGCWRDILGRAHGHTKAPDGITGWIETDSPWSGPARSRHVSWHRWSRHGAQRLVQSPSRVQRTAGLSSSSSSSATTLPAVLTSQRQCR